MRFVKALFIVFIPVSLLVLITACNEKKPTETFEIVPMEQLTFSGGYYPTVSPDGNWLAFRVSGDGIVKMDLTTSQLYILAACGTEPNWSRASNLVVFRTTEAGSEQSVLGIVNAANGDTSLFHTGDFDDGAEWSPDGTEIAAQSSAGMVVFSYPPGSVDTITCTDNVDGGCEGEYPTWSNDGEWLAFEDGLEIMKIPRSGGEAVQVVGGMNDVTEPAWSPDGKYIAFAMEDSTTAHTHLWVADARGTAFGLWRLTGVDTTCTLAECMDRNPCWSPDSDMIYFQSNRSGHNEIWRIGFHP
ncbi:MAG: hypothetical protein ACOYVF_07160 [Candidatus Zixiibacteriota bacterium]